MSTDQLALKVVGAKLRRSSWPERFIRTQWFLCLLASQSWSTLPPCSLVFVRIMWAAHNRELVLLQIDADWSPIELLLWPAVLQDRNPAWQLFNPKKDLFQTIFRIYCLVAGGLAPRPLTPCSRLSCFRTVELLVASPTCSSSGPFSCSAAHSPLPPPSMASLWPAGRLLTAGARGSDPVECPWRFMGLFYGREPCSQAELYSPVIRLD